MRQSEKSRVHGLRVQRVAGIWCIKIFRFFFTFLTCMHCSWPLLFVNCVAFSIFICCLLGCKQLVAYADNNYSSHKCWESQDEEMESQDGELKLLGQGEKPSPVID